MYYVNILKIQVIPSSKWAFDLFDLEIFVLIASYSVVVKNAVPIVA